MIKQDKDYCLGREHSGDEISAVVADGHQAQHIAGQIPMIYQNQSTENIADGLRQTLGRPDKSVQAAFRSVLR